MGFGVRLDIAIEVAHGLAYLHGNQGLFSKKQLCVCVCFREREISTEKLI